MAKFEFELTVEPREQYGKGASRRLRLREDKVLGIIYGGEDKPQPIMLAQHHVRKALENEAIFSHILTLSQGNKKERVVLKDMQRHPYHPKVMHMDFLRISENKPITMHVPLHFPGEKTAPGVVLEGGVVTHHMVELEIRCLPRHLPEYIEVDLNGAPLDTVVHLSQVTLPEGVELTTVIHGPEDDMPVVSIHKPKLIVEEEPVVEAAAEAEPKEGTEENKKEAQ